MLHAKYMHVKDTTISVAYRKAQLYMLNIQKRKVSALSRVSLNFQLMYASCLILKRIYSCLNRRMKINRKLWKSKTVAQ